MEVLRRFCLYSSNRKFMISTTLIVRHVWQKDLTTNVLRMTSRRTWSCDGARAWRYCTYIEFHPKFETDNNIPAMLPVVPTKIQNCVAFTSCAIDHLLIENLSFRNEAAFVMSPWLSPAPRCYHSFRIHKHNFSSHEDAERGHANAIPPSLNSIFITEAGAGAIRRYVSL